MTEPVPDPFPLPMPVTPGEERVIAAARGGAIAELAGLPAAQRVVRAELLIALLAGDNEDGRRTAAGLTLRHARIAGGLVLDGLGAPGAPLPPLALPYAEPASGAGIPVLARDAWLAALDLSYAIVARVEAQRVHCPNLVLTGLRVATHDGEVRLDGAQLGAGTWLNGIGALPPERPGPALVLADAALDGAARLQSVHLKQLVLSGAHIAGDASLGGAVLSPPPGVPALLAYATRIGGTLALPTADLGGSLRLLRAMLGGLSLGPLTDVDGQGGAAVILDGAHVAGPLRVVSGTVLHGELRALEAQVSGDLVVDPDARIEHAGGDALALAGAEIGGSLVLRGTRLLGSLRLPEAAISGDVALAEGATILAPHGEAIAAREAIIGGSLLLDGATVQGRMTLAGARLGGALQARGAMLATSAQMLDALDGTGMSVARDLLLAEPPASVAGRIILDRATVGGAVRLGALALAAAPAAGQAAKLSDAAVTLSLREARVAGALQVRLPSEAAGTIDLRGAQCGVLDDAGGAGWGPVRTRRGGVALRLDGFVYGRLAQAAGPELRRARLAFLMRQFAGKRPRAEEFADQPFGQLARTLRAQGEPEAADFVARQRRVLRQAAGVAGGPGRLAGALSGLLLGHGYSNGRTLATLGLWLVLGAGLLLLANDHGGWRGQVADPAARGYGGLCWMPEEVPRMALGRLDLPRPTASVGLEAVKMAADLALPGLPLGWADRCQVATAAGGSPWWGRLVAAWQALAWALLALGAASLTGLLRRD